jgi:hypothetical protein
MVCYQIVARFAFNQHKPVLVAMHIKKQKAKDFLVLSGLPFGSGLNYRRFSIPNKKRPGMSRIFIRSIKAALFPIPPFPAVSFICFRGFNYVHSGDKELVKSHLLTVTHYEVFSP